MPTTSELQAMTVSELVTLIQVGECSCRLGARKSYCECDEWADELNSRPGVE